jgi:ABC-type polysaccharide/polyol phosphate export permease
VNAGEATYKAGPGAALAPRGVLGITKKGLRLALDDLWDGFFSFRIWGMMGWNDVRTRYRRSLLGPFWLTISTAVMVGCMGPLFAKLFNQDIGSYLGFLAIGFVVWQLISQSMTDGCNAFIVSDGFIKQIKLPLSVYVLRVVWKNIIIFGHNLVVIVVVFLFLPPAFSPAILLFPLAVATLAINAVWVSLTLGMLCARFRDIPQLVTNLVQVAFFLTPVMWQPRMLGRHVWTVDLNPFYHFVEIIRGPLLGAAFNWVSWTAVLVITLLGYGFTIALYSRCRARIAFWV